MKKLTVIVFLISASLYCSAQNEGEITGKVLNAQTQESLPDAHLVLKRDGVKVSETASNAEGIYIFKPLKPGTYDISVLYTGYDTTNYKGIVVQANGINYQDFAISEGIVLGDITIRPSLVDDQVPGVVTTFDAEMIDNMVATSPLDIAAQAPAVHQDESSGGLFLAGSREDATMYVVDGVRVIGSLYVPMNSIQSISVLTGGIPANYGDFTGGIIEITTKEYSGIY